MENSSLPKENRNALIEENKDFILRTAESFCNKKLSFSDEQMNIALIAFNRSCESVKDLKSNFLGYASALIKDALLEYYIKKDDTPTFIFYEYNKEYNEYLASLSDFETYFENNTRMIELTLLESELHLYGFSLKSLASEKYRDKEINEYFLNIAIKIIKNQPMLERIISDRKLPCDEISSLLTCDIEKLKIYKNYIIFLLSVFSSDKYIYLKQFLNIKVGEENAKIGNSN